MCERARSLSQVTATETAPPLPQLLTTGEVCERLKIGRTKFYTLRKRLEQAGHPVRDAGLGPRCVRWPASVLPELLEALTAES